MSDDAKLKQVTEILGHIRELDAKIDDLKDQREMSAGPLEKAAMAYYTVRRPKSFSRGCACCFFVLEDTAFQQQVVVFSTDCSWCGRSGTTMRVARDELATYLPPTDQETTHG